MSVLGRLTHNSFVIPEIHVDPSATFHCQNFYMRLKTRWGLEEDVASQMSDHFCRKGRPTGDRNHLRGGGNHLRQHQLPDVTSTNWVPNLVPHHIWFKSLRQRQTLSLAFLSFEWSRAFQERSLMRGRGGSQRGGSGGYKSHWAVWWITAPPYGAATRSSADSCSIPARWEASQIGKDVRKVEQ